MTTKQKEKIQILYDWADGQYDSVPKSKMLNFITQDNLKDVVALVDKGYKKISSNQVVVDKKEYEKLLSLANAQQTAQRNLSDVLQQLEKFIDNESYFIAGRESESLLDRLAKLYIKIKGDIENDSN